MKSVADVARVIIKHLERAEVADRPIMWISREEIVSLAFGLSTQQLAERLDKKGIIFTEVPGGNFLLIDQTRVGKPPMLCLSGQRARRRRVQPADQELDESGRAQTEQEGRTPC
jgi:hypothetical protein